MTKFVRKHEIGGSRFGRLVVTNHISGGVWNCTCDCGNHKKHKGGDLVAGMYASCGCLLKEKIERSKLKIATNKKKFIDQVELRKYLSYDVLTGFFTWIVSPRFSVPIGTVVGLNEKIKKYVQVGLKNRVYPAHRLAWFYVHGEWPKGVIDHIDGDFKNNKIANLRDCSRSTNAQNQKRPHANNVVGLLGVSKSQSKTSPYRAQITINGKVTYIGTYKTPELAHQSYLDKKRELHDGCTI